MTMKKTNTSSGIGCGAALGMVIAVVLSWTAWHSILWAIVHGLLSWIYVIYYFIVWA